MSPFIDPTRARLRLAWCLAALSLSALATCRAQTADTVTQSKPSRATTGTPRPKTVDLDALARTAPIIVLARVDDPRNDVVDIPVEGPRGEAAAPYQRLRRHLTLIRALRGQAPETLRVDEADWKAQLAAYRACKAGGDCSPPALPHYRGTLAREPRPGQEVIAFLRRDADGDLELAAVRALDAASQLPALEAVLGASPGVKK